MTDTPLQGETRHFLVYLNDDETVKEHQLLYRTTHLSDGVRDCTLLITGQRFVGTGWKDSIQTLWALYKAADEWLDLMHGYKSDNKAVMQAYIGERNYHVAGLPMCGHERLSEPEEDVL